MLLIQTLAIKITTRLMICMIGPTVAHSIRSPPSKQGGVAIPLLFSQSLQNAKERDLGHIINLFSILCGHFDEEKKKKKNGATTLPGVG